MQTQDVIAMRLGGWVLRRDVIQTFGQATPYEDVFIETLSTSGSMSEIEIKEELKRLAQDIRREKLMGQKDLSKLSDQEKLARLQKKARGRALLWLLGHELAYTFPNSIEGC